MKNKLSIFAIIFALVVLYAPSAFAERIESSSTFIEWNSNFSGSQASLEGGITRLNLDSHELQGSFSIVTGGIWPTFGIDGNEWVQATFTATSMSSFPFERFSEPAYKVTFKVSSILTGEVLEERSYESGASAQIGVIFKGGIYQQAVKAPFLITGTYDYTPGSFLKAPDDSCQSASCMVLAYDVPGAYVTVTAIPEPGSFSMLTIGLCVMALMRSRRRASGYMQKVILD